MFFSISLRKYIFFIGNPALPRVLIVTSTVYPNLLDVTGKLNFCFRNRPILSLESQNLAENIPVVLPSSPGKSVKGYSKLLPSFSAIGHKL